MTKSVLITTPASKRGHVASITPGTDLMGLTDTNPDMIYGFHGNPNTKGAAINAAYHRATAKGEKFYMIDITYAIPDGFNETMLHGLLPPKMLDKVPFLITKRITRGCAEELGDLWADWAKEHYGNGPVVSARVDWSDVMSFIPEFPHVIDRLFLAFPNLRCAVIPMKVTDKLLPTDITWVGVSPKSMTGHFVHRAEVRMQPDITVNLAF